MGKMSELHASKAAVEAVLNKLDFYDHMWEDGDAADAANVMRRLKVRLEALDHLMTLWWQYKQSDGNQASAYNLLVKKGRPHWDALMASLIDGDE